MIEVKNVSLKVGYKHILDDVSFKINKGEIVGLLGHNGAGKSTLHRFIANQEELQLGEIYVDGKRNEFGKPNGVVFLTDEIVLVKSLTVEENIMHFKGDDIIDVEYITERLKEFKIKLSNQVSALSSGHRQLVNLIFHLSTKPKVILFDEPLSAVDVFNRKKISDIIIDAQIQGTTIMFTTHLIADFHMLLERIVYIDDGKVAFDKTYDEIISEGNENLEEYLFEVFGGDQYE